jgi:ketosteroid isomerase-like protein
MTVVHDTPKQVVEALLTAFNSGDMAAIDDLYEPDGVVVPRPGMAISGSARVGSYAHLQGLTMTAEVRHSYVVDDIALLVVDWTLKGTNPYGHEVDLTATATDVFRRAADGNWRYVIDNPHGGA